MVFPDRCTASVLLTILRRGTRASSRGHRAAVDNVISAADKRTSV
jgi:hypothetical protein